MWAAEHVLLRNNQQASNFRDETNVRFETVLVGKASLPAHPAASCYLQHHLWNMANESHKTKQFSLTGHKRIISLIQAPCDPRDRVWPKLLSTGGNKIQCRGTITESGCLQQWSLRWCWRWSRMETWEVSEGRKRMSGCLQRGQPSHTVNDQ